MSVRRVGRRRARAGRQLQQRRAARRAHQGQRQQRRRRAPRHFLPSFCFADLIFLSMPARSIESPSPSIARVPRGDRIVVARELEEHVAVVILNDRVGLELFGRALAGWSTARSQLVGLVVRPAEAVEIRAVVRLDFERLLQQVDRLVQPLAALGEHVAEIVERRRVVRDLSTAPAGTRTRRRRTSSACRAPRRARTESSCRPGTSTARPAAPSPRRRRAWCRGRSARARRRTRACRAAA